MTTRRLLFVVLAGTAVVAAGVACGAGDESTTSLAADGGGVPPIDGGITFGDGGATPNATGVLLVHAAAYPGFRVCFDNFPKLLPQPDAKTLPQANLVGVEMGGVVRVGPIAQAPGKIYLIDRRNARAGALDPNDTACGDLLRNLKANLDYVVAGEIDRPVGVDRAEAMVFTGCAPSAYFDSLGVTAADCGPSYTDSQHGNITATILALRTTNTSTASTLPVEVTNVSPLLTSLVPQGQRIEVSFGDLADAGAHDASATAPLPQPVASGLELFDASAPVTLALNQQAEATYGRNGFRILVGAGGDSTFHLDETLADIQQLSRPESNPTTYFVTPSNYAFFLLGDPRIAKTFSDGGANPSFDPRRAMHLLAVPVNDEQDAGALGASADAGASDASR